MYVKVAHSFVAWPLISSCLSKCLRMKKLYQHSVWCYLIAIGSKQLPTTQAKYSHLKVSCLTLVMSTFTIKKQKGLSCASDSVHCWGEFVGLQDNKVKESCNVSQEGHRCIHTSKHRGIHHTEQHHYYHWRDNCTQWRKKATTLQITSCFTLVHCKNFKGNLTKIYGYLSCTLAPITLGTEQM